jgi:tRNA modification GTPase
MEWDTIAAISTPFGEGAIGIVRLSGVNAIQITNTLFQSTKHNGLLEASSHTVHYGKIVNPKTNHTVDEVLITIMRAPKTFTREDVVEINCHGGIVTTNHVLQVVLENGAKLAEPGEFTKRALLNGRIDLSQAEAVMDLIRSKTDEASRLAMSQVEGRLSKEIRMLRQELVNVIAHIEVNIDYPEYDEVEEMTAKMVLPKLKEIEKGIQTLLSTAKQGKILREGLSVSIVGKPNVGKSSLFNALLQENRAIVTNIPGTTRDILEEYIHLEGIPLKVIDTAGIRETDDVVEKIGVGKSVESMEKADVILFILDQSLPLTQEDIDIYEQIKNRPHVIVYNKLDLPTRIHEVENKFVQEQPISLSAVNGTNLDMLGKKIKEMFFGGELKGLDQTYVSNARHIALLEEAMQYLQKAKEGATSHFPIDVVQIDITRSWELLGEIIGEHVQEGLINELFKQFCLGK